MTNFNESVLSKLIAREIILSQDRAPFLAFTTPIYCPDRDGVKASKVNIIAPDPLVNTITTTTIEQENGVQSSTNTVTETSKVAIGGKETVTKITNTVSLETATINYMDEYFDADSGRQIDFSKDFDITFTYIYPATQAAGDLYTVFNYANDEENMYSNSIVLRVNATVTEGAISNVELSVGSTKKNAVVNLYTQMVDPPLVVGSGYDFKFHWQASTQKFLMTITEHATGRLLLAEQDRPGSSADGMKPQEDSQDSSDYTLANTTSFSAESELLSYTEVSETSVFTPVENVKTITLDKAFNYSFDIPYDVQLKSRVALYPLVISNARQKFLSEVNTAVSSINWQTEATNQSKTLNSVTKASTDTNATMLATLLTNMATVGTAPKFSVYSYDNGAPVEYNYNQDIPTVLGDNITPGKPFDYAMLDDVDVPAMYYYSKPTVVLQQAAYTSIQEDLLDGSLKSYTTSQFNFDISNKTKSTVLGECGTNDVVAVAFTQPKISIEASKYDFKYTVTVQMYYGLSVIHLENYNQIVSGE